MHSYNTRFQAKRAQAEFQTQQEFQAPHVITVICPSQPSKDSQPSRRHRYDTRFEINRIRNAVILRDCGIVSNLLLTAEAHQETLDRVNACIDVFTYLRWNPALFQMKTFADTVYKKMGELETDCLNHIQSQGVASHSCHTLLALLRDISDFMGTF